MRSKWRALRSQPRWQRCPVSELHVRHARFGIARLPVFPLGAATSIVASSSAVSVTAGAPALSRNVPLGLTPGAFFPHAAQGKAMPWRSAIRDAARVPLLGIDDPGAVTER